MPLTIPGRVKKLAVEVGGNNVEAMLARQNLNGLPATVHDIYSGAMGCLGGEPLSRNGNMLAITGTPINGPDLNQITDADAAKRLLPQYDGAFAAVFWDAQQHVLVVVTDCLGMQPLYMRESEAGLLLVSETKAIDAQPDLAAWGAFISVGNPIAGRSLVDDLKRVPPASVLVYDSKRRSLAISRYWDWPEPSDAWRHYDFLGALEAEIKAYAAVTDPGTLLLSGGFDSRLLLFLLKRAQVPVDALIVAHDDELNDADGRLAEEIAKTAAIDYRIARPGNNFFSSSGYLEHLVASDVGYPSLNLFISKVACQINSTIVWDGLMPGILFNPVGRLTGSASTYWQSEVQGPDSAVWNAARSVFKPEFAEAMFAEFHNDLSLERCRLPPDGYGLSRFIIENRARNRVSINPHKIYANRAAVLTPGLSKDFVAHAASIPFEYKQAKRFSRILHTQLDKRTARIPVVSGGDLVKGSHFGSKYYRERLRMEINRCRLFYPSIFGKAAVRKPMRSTFLDERLLDPEDRYLNPGLRKHLQKNGSDADRAWKLLFHWRAWHWVHEGRLFRMLGKQGSTVD